MATDKQQPATDADKRQALMNDPTVSGAAALIRENARLLEDNAGLRKQTMRVWAAVAALSLLLIALCYIWFSMFPKYQYVATINNQAVCPIESQPEANITPVILADFAKDAAISSYTYDYVNYQNVLTYVSGRYYTDTGRAAYLRSLDESGNLEKVIKGRLILKTWAIKSPQLEEEGLLDGTRRYWVVTVPLAIEFYSGGGAEPKSRQNFLARVTVTQVEPSSANVKGIGVESLVLSPYSARN